MRPACVMIQAHGGRKELHEEMGVGIGSAAEGIAEGIGGKVPEVRKELGKEWWMEFVIYTGKGSGRWYGSRTGKRAR